MCLVQDNKDIIRRIAYKVYKQFGRPSSIDFDDLISEANLAALQNADKWKPELGAFHSYIWRFVRFACTQFIIRNRTCLSVGRAKSRKAAEIAQYIQPGAPIPEIIKDTGYATRIDVSLVTDEDTDKLEDALDVLDSEEREWLVLWLEGNELQVIGERFGVHYSTVSRRIRGALKKLQELLA